MAGATKALVRALAAGAGAEPEVLSIGTSDWSSATFTGTRHRLTIRLPAPAAGRLAEAVAGDRLAPHGHLIVDLTLTPGAHDPGLWTIAATTVQAA